MSSSRARFARLITIVLAFAVAAGCSGGKTVKGPPGAQVLHQAADTMRTITSLAFTLRTQGDPKVNVKSVDAKLLKNGNAQGSVQVTELGMPIQLDFVVLGKTVHFKGLTGGWQQDPLARVARIYDPSAVLDPNRGLVQLLLTARDAKTEKTEKVAGQSCYKVHALLSKAAVARLVPGITTDPPADIWVATADHRVLKASLEVPANSGSKPATVIAAFSDFDTPFPISVPAK